MHNSFVLWEFLRCMMADDGNMAKSISIFEVETQSSQLNVSSVRRFISLDLLYRCYICIYNNLAAE